MNRPAAPAPEAVLEWATTVQSTSERIIRRLTGEYHEDQWGFDEEFTEAVFPIFEFLYSVWWRVQVEGASNVPGHGRALLVANIRSSTSLCPSSKLYSPLSVYLDSVELSFRVTVSSQV